MQQEERFYLVCRARERGLEHDTLLALLLSNLKQTEIMVNIQKVNCIARKIQKKKEVEQLTDGGR